MKNTHLPIEVQEIALKVSSDKQNEVQKVLNDIFDNTAEWEQKVDSINVKNINDSFSIDLANTARINAKKARLNGEKIFDTKRGLVQQQMAGYKLEDQLWLKSKQIMQLKLKAIEEKAKYKADYVKRYELEQHELKITDRLNKLLPFSPEITRQDIESLTYETFNVVLSGYKKKYNDKIEAEKLAELDRIAAEKAEQKRIADIEKENEKLAKEKDKSEKERIKLAEIQAAKDKKADLERQRIAKIQNEKLAKEKAEKQKLADELESKRVAEIKAKQKLLADKEAELNKGDTAKVKDLINDLSNIKSKYTFKSEKNRQMYMDVNNLLDKVINHIK